MMGEVKLPERDVDRRKVFCSMLHISCRAGNKFTMEELEDICIKRGYLTVVEEAKGGASSEYLASVKADGQVPLPSPANSSPEKSKK
jgi:hypothetical protein